MAVRELKYYKWVFDKDKVTLVNKKNNQNFVLTLALADSFSRAVISFRNTYRIAQVNKWRELLKKSKENTKVKVVGLREQIKNLRTKNKEVKHEVQ